MVTYNSARFVRIAIESVLAQSYSNLELIISDDASSDETWDIINSYQDLRIKAYRNEININEYPNRSKILSLARGEYFIFIDGDDVLYPHGLEFMVKMLMAFPECAMALSLPPRNYFIYPCKLSPRQVALFDYFGRSVTLHGFPYTLFKTSILREVGITDKYIAGDTFIKKSIAMLHDVLLIPEGSAWWRVSPGQASSRLKLNLAGHIEALEYNSIILFNDTCPLTKTEKEKAYRDIKRNFLVAFVKEYVIKFKIKKAFQIFRKSRLKLSDLLYLFYKKSPHFERSLKGNYITNIDRDPFSVKHITSIEHASIS
ncbi:glycosyltransferase [Pontibacter sp. KCTC 32443]|uniref:glycosyltransferase family 2 protein n=1 Tax=Pontibacter TaxID=323449 RepID=UPI00164D531E|nr:MULTISPECIES: glycosyltransferase family 2 protein [Pontibacter]MBC5773493.1 glycosyltransferase [Pontibacter sp. KCTC 32443]